MLRLDGPEYVASVGKNFPLTLSIVSPLGAIALDRLGIRKQPCPTAVDVSEKVDPAGREGSEDSYLLKHGKKTSPELRIMIMLSVICILDCVAA